MKFQTVFELGLLQLAQAGAHTNLSKRCTELANNLALENTTVWFSELVKADTNLTFPDNHPTCAQPYQVVSQDICRVSLLTTTSTSPPSNISIEAWLPIDWNGRYLSTGNGGLNGCIKYEDVAYGVSQGFATVGTNNGHNGTSGEPFYKNAGTVENFVYRSLHLGTVLGKQITEQFYGKKHHKAYYIGCSTGGRQGFKEAQSFPDDFDGILVGAPAFDMVDLMSWSGHFYTLSGPPGSPGFVTTEQWALVVEDVLKQCDGLDGLEDGIIEDPNLCRYRPEALLCGSQEQANSTSCLTPKQANTVRQVFSELHGKDGKFIYPRLEPGANPAYMVNGQPFAYSTDWYRYVVYENPDLDPATIGPEEWAVASEQNQYNIATWEGDLSGVRDRGTKILHYHGLQDSLISSDNSERYYNHVARTMDLTTDEIDEFYRYFRISGMDHCGGGPGANKIGNSLDAVDGYKPKENVLSAIVHWVEDGVAPEFVQGTGTKDDETFVRRHCKYPLRGKYKGKGDWKKASSWECV